MQSNILFNAFLTLAFVVVVVALILAHSRVCSLIAHGFFGVPNQAFFYTLLRVTKKRDKWKSFAVFLYGTSKIIVVLYENQSFQSILCHFCWLLRLVKKCERHKTFFLLQNDKKKRNWYQIAGCVVHPS